MNFKSNPGRKQMTEKTIQKQVDRKIDVIQKKTVELSFSTVQNTVFLTCDLTEPYNFVLRID